MWNDLVVDMSNKEERSKYLPLFYSEQQPQVKPESSKNVPGSIPSRPLSQSDKFKNPADFFKSSQSVSSQGPNSSQVRPQLAKSSHIQPQRQLDNKTSFGGGGSTHEMLSQSFQAKKPVMRPVSVPSTSFAKPSMTRFHKPFSQPSHRKPFVGLDENVASTKALELQWTTKMRQAKKAELEAQKLQNAGNMEKRNLARSDTGKSPMGKSFWADVSFTKTDAACKNQQNDPWYSNDVWGDDLSIEAVDECLRVASTQEAKKSMEQFGLDDALSSWMDESWASPEKVPSQSQHQAKTGAPTAKMVLFADKPKEKTDEFVDLLSGDPAFLALLDSVESQQKLSLSSSSMSKGSSMSSGNVPRLPFGSLGCAASSQNLSRSRVLQKTSAPRPALPRKSVPLSERMPVSSMSGDRSSFVIKAKEFESPSKNEGLSLSQRKLQKPTKSLPSPSTQTSKHQTEWLRGQLEKINCEYSTLKEDVQVKEGESKLLREKLKTAEEEVKKHRLEKTKELEILRESFEKKVKQLEKQLEATQVQAIFKAKEAESSLEKYRELKSMSVHGPEFPATGPSFKGLSLAGSRPGESAKVLADATASTNEIIDETMEVFSTPKKQVEELELEEPSENRTFDNSLVKVEVEYEQPAAVEMPVVIEKLEQSSPKNVVFDYGFIKRNSVLIQAADQIVHRDQPRKELNHFLKQPMEYLPHMLLQTEFSEQEVENYPVRRPTLVELWGTSYNAFGDAVLDDYEKAQVGEVVPLDPARSILSKGRYFSTLESVHGNLITLSNKSQWGPSERTMAKNIVDLAMSMTRELFATLGDPRFLRTTYTIYDRDPKVLNDFQDCSELITVFDPLSPKRWKYESFVELRRCLVVVGLLCSMDHMTTRYIINPRAYKSGRTQEFYPPNTENIQNTTRRSNKNKDFIIRLMVSQGERKPTELKLMQMYRDLHSKKLTIVSELASALVPKSYVVSQPPKAGKIESSDDIMDTETVSNALKMYDAGWSMEMALKEALESSENAGEFRTDVVVESQPSLSIENALSYDKYKDCLSKLDLKLDSVYVRDFVVELEGVLNPKRISLLHGLAVEPQTRRRILDTDAMRDWVTVPSSFVEATDSEILNFDLDNSSIALCAPINRCITNLEQNMMRMALSSIEELKSRVCNAIANDVQSDLDFTRYVHNSNDADAEVSRKRKISIEDIYQPRKTLKVAEYHTPEFDKSLYSQIQRKDNDDDEVVVLETQTQQLSSPTEDDQIAKFEKREEIAELKKKMLAEEKETKHHQLSSRHSFAPVRLPGRHSPSCEESASREVVMEIEQMFQSQAKPDAVDESVWSSDESDDEYARLKTLNAENEDYTEIEFIPELVKKFHHKLQNAGLLELLCEVFKDGGVLRYTYKLNGVMLGTLLMLQKLVMYQKKEVEPYYSKMATIIREILYARPSPRIVLEVNLFLRHAIGIDGFTKMLCHNASQETFVLCPDQVYFTRGACLLEVICVLVTYATDDDTDVQMYFELSHWVYHIICSQKKHMASLYEQHYANRRRCMCITALNNTMIMIYHRALSLYRGQTVTRSGDLPKRKVLEKIFLYGLQVLRMMYTYGPFSFLISIKTQYFEYRQFLLWLREMHENELFYEGFSLSTANLFIVIELLKDTRDPNPTPEPSPEMTSSLDLENFFHPGKQWPYDFNNTDSLVKSDSSESEED